MLLQRVAVLVAALVYIVVSMRASITSIRVLRLQPLPPVPMQPDETLLMAQWIGVTTVRDSPLVVRALNQVTTPRNETIYLQSAASVSLVECSSASRFDRAIYANAYLRTIFNTLVRDAAYNMTFLKEIELVAPIVDCSFGPLQNGDQHVLRAFFLTRQIAQPNRLKLLTFSYSMQDYSIPKQNQRGPAGLATIGVIEDMRVQTVPQHIVFSQGYPFAGLKFQVYTRIGKSLGHEWIIQSIPANLVLESPKVVVTSSKIGFYIGTTTEQSNAMSRRWEVDQVAPFAAVSKWRWEGGPVLYDSWGWVHCIHLLFVADTVVGLIVLFVIVTRKLAQGYVWIGDAFTSISTSLLRRGVLVLMTWIVNDRWALYEFCYAMANEISRTRMMYIHPEVFHADLLTIFLSISSMLGGYVFRERINPAVLVAAFEVAFHYRVEVGRAFPHTTSVLRKFAELDVALAKMPISDVTAKSTPMRLVTMHPIATRRGRDAFYALLPIFCMLGIVVLLALGRKVYRVFVPESLTVRHVSNYSERLEDLAALRSSLTGFEIATGAALQRRLGLVCDYDNCIYIKGEKYASADGIYSSGYIILGRKWLLATRDLLPVLMMKILRFRFKNIYVFEVDGNTVQRKARLVYPQTIGWREVVALNVDILD
ncbi:hypothetical protein PINS_up007393 [Pythium insidiosum]|nr:hypothetical protein PINS_up007393 [Pythium insidiosum]